MSFSLRAYDKRHVNKEAFLERIPNRQDSDNNNSYINLYWSPTPWHNLFFNFIYRFLYFITGPKFVLPILGDVHEKCRPFKIPKDIISFL